MSMYDIDMLNQIWFQNYHNQYWLWEYKIIIILTTSHHNNVDSVPFTAWWRHQMETFSALLAISAGNSPVSGEFPAQRPVTRSFDVFFDLRLNKRLSKQSWGWWFETLSRPIWRHRNGNRNFARVTALSVTGDTESEFQNPRDNRGSLPDDPSAFMLNGQFTVY